LAQYEAYAWYESRAGGVGEAFSLSEILSGIPETAAFSPRQGLRFSVSPSTRLNGRVGLT
jgi:hypothetical protein